MIPKAITRDLQLGMGLEECLIKHNTNLKELFESNPKKKIIKKNKVVKSKKQNIQRTVSKGIQERNGKFYVRKYIDGGTKLFGVYKTHEDALAVREELEKQGWKRTNVDKVCKTLNIKRIVNYNTKVRYS